MKLSPTLVLCIATQAFGFEILPDYDPQNVTQWEYDYGYYPWLAYKSFDLIAPSVRAAITSPQCDDGLYTFLTPRGNSIKDPGNVIVDSSGELIYAALTPGQSYGFRPQMYKGQPYLTYWVGDDRIRGHGIGTYHLLDATYQHRFEINALNNLHADLHELVITAEGTALITIYQNMTSPEISAQMGLDEFWIWDSLFQEIDIATNTLLFQWRASDHHALSETFKDDERGPGWGTATAPFDFYHINSVQKDGLGNYLISARLTSTVSYINGSDGSLLWVLGGKRNMFRDLSGGQATNFAWQHDARMHSLDVFPKVTKAEIVPAEHGVRSNGAGAIKQLLTIFDNAAENTHKDRSGSRGMLLEIDYPHPQHSADLYSKQNQVHAASEQDNFRVKLIRDYIHPQSVISSSQGSLQVIPDADDHSDPKILVGYGYNAVYTEFDTNGTVLCDMHFATNFSWDRGEVQSYRTYRLPWAGYPTDPPSIYHDAKTHAFYVSWNGATEIKSWIMEDSSSGRLDWAPVGGKLKTSFETRIAYDPRTIRHYVRIRALDEFGETLGETETIDTRWTGILGRTVACIVGRPPSVFRVMLLLGLAIITAHVLLGLHRRIRWWRYRRGRAHTTFKIHNARKEDSFA